jgi:hypothetical protein
MGGSVTRAAAAAISLGVGRGACGVLFSSCFCLSLTYHSFCTPFTRRFISLNGQEVAAHRVEIAALKVRGFQIFCFPIVAPHALSTG